MPLIRQRIRMDVQSDPSHCCLQSRRKCFLTTWQKLFNSSAVRGWHLSNGETVLHQFDIYHCTEPQTADSIFFKTYRKLRAEIIKLISLERGANCSAFSIAACGDSVIITETQPKQFAANLMKR